MISATVSIRSIPFLVAFAGTDAAESRSLVHAAEPMPLVDASAHPLFAVTSLEELNMRLEELVDHVDSLPRTHGPLFHASRAELRRGGLASPVVQKLLAARRVLEAMKPLMDPLRKRAALAPVQRGSLGSIVTETIGSASIPSALRNALVRVFIGHAAGSWLGYALQQSRPLEPWLAARLADAVFDGLGAMLWVLGEVLGLTAQSDFGTAAALCSRMQSLVDSVPSSAPAVWPPLAD